MRSTKANGEMSVLSTFRVMLFAAAALMLSNVGAHSQGTTRNPLDTASAALAFERFEEAQREFTAAISREDHPAGNQRLSIQALIGQADIGHQRGQFAEALRAIRRAQDLAAELLGTQSVEYAHASLVRGEIDQFMSSAGLWLQHCDTAIRILDRLPRAPPQLFARALACRSGFRFTHRDNTGSKQDLERALTLIRPVARAYPSLRAALSIQNAMSVINESPRHPLIDQELHSARRICHSQIGENSLCAMQVMLVTGSVQAFRGELDASIQTAHAGLNLARQILGPDHLVTIHFNHMLLTAYQGQERYEEFLDLADEVERQYGLTLPRDSPPNYAVREKRSIVLAALGRLDAAIWLMEDVIGSREAWFGQDAPPLHRSLGIYHSLLTLAGRDAEARLVQERIDRIGARIPR
jgi:tetratricopeptide (TPR) repeat protein